MLEFENLHIQKMGVGIEAYIKSRLNVQFLKTDPKARYQGYAFYFREGFCWIDVNSTYLKARVKAKGIFDVTTVQ